MGWVRTTIWPAYEGSVRISPHPVAAVVKTRSPSAGRRLPWRAPVRTRPPSSARSPGVGPRAASGTAVGAAWGTALGIDLLSGITVPALKDGGNLADSALPGRSRIGADELHANDAPTASHPGRPPPAGAAHAEPAGRRARRGWGNAHRACRAD